jgi:hypothetical protein
MSERRWMLSPCCAAMVVVPVEVTAHLYVTGAGKISTSIGDTASTIRTQALQSEQDITEAYCVACGASVPSGSSVSGDTP